MSKRICNILLVFLLLSFPLEAAAVVSQLSFTTDPQSVVPGTISDTLTVQLQDASGASSPASETMDVVFSSTSVTGEFLSPSSDNPATKTISTGSANKNFRYRDSTEGTFTLTIKATGRTSGHSWMATQTIIVSAASTSTASSTSDTATSHTQTSGAPPSNSVYYIYYVSVPLSASEAKKSPELSAGLNRLATVGSPLEFKVETDEPHLKRSIYSWNFGDGSEERGEVLSHTYWYPGDYVVVLNADFPEGKAVSRANVKVVSPDLRIVSATPEWIEIGNNSSNEISLFGRAVWSNGKSFVFPQDSIVLADRSVFIPSTVSNLHPRGVNDVFITVIRSMEGDKIAKGLEEVKATEILALQGKLESLKAQLANMSQSSIPLSQTPPVATAPPAVTESSTSSETEAAVAVKSGWFETLKKFLLGIK